jgi:hypothetical protein
VTVKIKYVLAASFLVASCLPLALVRAQEHTVTDVKAVANPKEYNGPCPATIEFIGTIFVSHHPARVTYYWERSDGAKGPRETVDIRSAGQGVSTKWQVGQPGRNFNGWEKLHVIAPTGITSDEATFRVRCR